MRYIYEKYGIITYLQKCKRETHHAIMIADRLAKKATKWCNINTASLYCPISLKTAKKLTTKQMYKSLLNLQKHHIISCNIYQWRKYLNDNLDVEKELELKQYETSILLKLRSSHNELNRAKHILKHYKLYQNIQMKMTVLKFGYIHL
eukprot:438568_1